MAEIKADNLTILEVGDDEFHLSMEEEKRDCMPCIYLALTAGDGKQYPAIMLRSSIENKEAYMDTIADSSWFLLQDRSNSIKLLFLNLDFRGAGKMKFCLDFSPGFLNTDNREEMAIWLQDLILSDGKIAVVDGDGPAIGVTGITLELPRLLLTGGL
jgi:hypothetical protein